MLIRNRGFDVHSVIKTNRNQTSVLMTYENMPMFQL